MLKRLFIRTLVLLSFFVISSHMFAHFAKADEDAPNVQATPSVKDDYDFSWLDPDKKIYVVQNRKYEKRHKAEFGLNGGIGFGEPYRNSLVFMPRLSYYFNESWGLSAIANFASIGENNNFRSLKSVSSVIPTVRDTTSWEGLSLLWIPFYAKINVFNKILYVDWQFELGGSMATSEIDLNTSASGSANVSTDSYVGFYWGTGQKFFLSREWAIRWDLIGMYYSAPTARAGALLGSNETKDNYYFTLGASVTF